MDPNRNKNENEDDDIPDSKERVRWYGIWHQLESDGVDLMAHTDKYKGSKEHIKHWVVWYQD